MYLLAHAVPLWMHQAYELKESVEGRAYLDLVLLFDPSKQGEISEEDP